MLFHKYKNKIKEFNDGTIVEWADHTSILYIKGSYIKAISCDYSGFWIPFLIPQKCNIENYLKEWDKYPQGFSKKITKEQQKDILLKLKSFLGRDFDKIAVCPVPASQRQTPLKND